MLQAGATFWMLDDNWPAESWTSLEWGGRPKLLHYAAMRFNAKLTVSTYCTPSITACTAVAVHVSSELLSEASGTLSLTAIRWQDARTGIPTTVQVALNPQSGFNFTVADDDFIAILKSAGCDVVADCFIEAKLTSSGQLAGGENDAPMLLAPVTHQWLALWRNITLLPATLAVTTVPSVGAHGASTGAVAVTVTSNVITPNVMVHCGKPTDFGAFDSNGVLLMPGVPQTLVYTPKAFAAGGRHDPCTSAKDFYAVAINGIST
jgi:beta-mannosidase